MATRKRAARAPAPKSAAVERVEINRAPVLTLWAAVVAERLGHDREAALTLGRAVAGMNAASKARAIGLAEPRAPGAKPKPRPAAEAVVVLLGRRVPVVKTRAGLRAARDGKPDSAESVERYLAGKFGEALHAARAAMTALAKAFSKPELEERAFSLYEAFRPGIPSGQRGWGARGTLDLARVRALAPSKRPAR